MTEQLGIIYSLGILDYGKQYIKQNVRYIQTYYNVSSRQIRVDACRLRDDAILIEDFNNPTK